MKKFISAFLLVLVLLVTGFSFTACDNYSRKEFVLTNFTLLKADGTELNVAEYKKFFNIVFSGEQEIARQYNMTLEDIDSVKNYILAKDSYRFVFGSKNDVEFEHIEITDNVLRQREIKTAVGTYDYMNNALTMKFTNYQYDASGNIIHSTAGNPMTEEINKIPEFNFGIAKGNFTISRVGDSSFVLTIYSGVSTTSSRAELVFTLKK